MLTASVHGKKIECRQVSDRKIEVDGEILEIDIKQLDDHLFSLLIGGKCYLVHRSVGRKDPHGEELHRTGARNIVMSIKGVEYDVSLDDEKSLLLKEFFAKSHSGSASQIVRAPMPGLISRVEVEVGTTIVKGQGLLVLEAMKMENEIRALGNGRIKVIHVQNGNSVEKDEPLITIEEL